LTDEGEGEGDAAVACDAEIGRVTKTVCTSVDVSVEVAVDVTVLVAGVADANVDEIAKLEIADDAGEAEADTGEDVGAPLAIPVDDTTELEELGTNVELPAVVCGGAPAKFGEGTSV
jgi:hypothetical protein